MANRDPWVSRTNVSKHAGALRVSLLVSLGLTHLACGGTVISQSDGDSGSGGVGGRYTPIGGTGPYIFGGATNGGATNGGGPVTAGAGGAGDRAIACTSPKTDARTGLVSCAEGIVHRPKAMKCAQPPLMDPAVGGATGEAGAASANGTCELDSQCSGLRLGYCDHFSDGPRADSACKSGCLEDSDCGSGFCQCDGSATGGKCVTASCLVDANCGAGSLCADYSNPCGPGGFACLQVDDECLSRKDCQGGSCSVSLEGHRSCNNAVCGRPFLVDNAPRLAPIEARSDWRDATTPDLTGLTALQRATLAAHWSRLGQMEHASIGAFARFNLQLLSLGAPGELVEACNQALVDETAHTRLCFALASQYGGTRVGPGKLEVRDCFEDMSLTAILKLVIREGCIGETVAALEAVEAAAQSTDPAVKSALLRIARDEQSHAELAFKFLNWGLAHSSPEARRELALVAEAQLEAFEYAAFGGAGSEPVHGLSDHGVLCASALRAVHLSAAGEVVRPLLRASLFSQSEMV